jgi:hypothetical protein
MQCHSDRVNTLSVAKHRLSLTFGNFDEIYGLILVIIIFAITLYDYAK